jgi:HlyD family secretion protein
MRFIALAALLLLAACDDAAKAKPWLGYVEGERVAVAAPEGGWIEALSVAEGDVVAVGQALFRLNAEREIAQRGAALARLSQAEAQLSNLLTGRRPDEIAAAEAKIAAGRSQLELARRELARQQELAGSPAASRRLLDQARSVYDAERAQLAEVEAQLRVARLPGREGEISAAHAQMEAAAAALAEADWRLAERRIAARVAGRVERVVRRAGELAPTGGVVLSLLPPDGVHVRLYVPEADLARLPIGAELSIGCDGCPAGLTARVGFVAGEAEFTPPVLYTIEGRKKLVYLVKATPSAPGLKPGQPIEARLK